jgi:hypothetical protein
MNPKKTDVNGRGAISRHFAFGLANYLAFTFSLAAIIAGYVLLDRGSVTAAPLLLVFGYAVLIPVGLILGWRRLG